MSYMNRTIALMALMAAAACVPTEQPVVGNASTGLTIVAEAEAAKPAMDYHAMEAEIRPSRADGQVFEYY